MTVVGIGAGQILLRSCRSRGAPGGSLTFGTVAGGWFTVALLGAVPIWFTAVLGPGEGEAARAYGTFVDALFEGMSGFTSCGLSMSSRSDLLPVSLQWWRSIMQWVGGIGVIALALLLTEPAEAGHDLLDREGDLGNRSRVSLKRTLMRVWLLYSGYTVALVVGFLFSGVPPWEAVNHGMSGISTGGFDITGRSMRDYTGGSRAIALTGMIIGATSFRVHTLFWVRRDWRRAGQNTQLRWMLAIIGLGFLVLVGCVSWTVETRLSDVAFQWITALTTCGYMTSDLSMWPNGPLLVLMAGMLVGGASGSTAGGLKLMRVAWIGKGLVGRLRELSSRPTSRVPHREDGREVVGEVARQRIRSAALLLALWLLVLFAAGVIMLSELPDEPSLHVLFETVSALATAGLSTGMTGGDFPTTAKLTLIIVMWMGRLEITAVLVLLLGRPLFSFDSIRFAPPSATIDDEHDHPGFDKFGRGPAQLLHRLRRPEGGTPGRGHCRKEV